MKNTTLAAAVFALLMLFGCVPKVIEQPSVFLYECDANNSFTASFDKLNDQFTISGFGITKVLPHLISGSGARYGDDEMIYWSKGSDATLTFKNKVYNCSIKSKPTK
jgi:membrane-bound inhibitor of C-type lysozyme